jgi:hypothetical protein
MSPGGVATRRVGGLLGALALALAGVFAPARAEAARGEPLAAALAPLGPLKSLASSLLWARLLDEQMHGAGERATGLARALLELHPDLETVREYLAQQLVVTEAPRAPGAARHAALVAAGLALLEQGLELRESPRLHGALGRLLATQRRSDPGFRGPAEAWAGDALETVALLHLRRSELHLLDRVLLAGLLLERGERELDAGDAWAARRDWQDARAALQPLRELDGAQVDEQLGGLAGRLREAGVDPGGSGPVEGPR